jgi:hypothetical protein
MSFVALCRYDRQTTGFLKLNIVGSFLFKTKTIIHLTIVFSGPTKNHSKNIPKFEKPTRNLFKKLL